MKTNLSILAIITFAAMFTGSPSGDPRTSLCVAPATPSVSPLNNNGKSLPAGATSKIFRVTAYCPCVKCCGACADGITASGNVIRPSERFCAAPVAFSFGMMLDIPGYGVVPVWDRGGVIRGNRLDVYFDTHSEALCWGVQTLTVKIYRK